EGHPDNVAAALYGGLTVSCALGEGRIATVSLPVPASLRWIVLVPEVTSATAEARAVLPDSVPRADAVFNVQRVALLLAGLQSGRADAIAGALDDRLHQPYRRRLFPWLPSVVDAARGAGALGCVLSGRFGPRPMIITGVLLLASASALASTIQAPWHLYLYTGVLGALGLVALGWVPMGLLLSRWFQARRGRMAGVAFSGMGFGVFVIGPVTQWLIAATGWRTASLILGLAALVVLLPLVLWGIRDPAPREAPATDRARLAGAATTATPARPDATLRDALR